MDDYETRDCRRFLKTLYRAEDDDPDKNGLWGYYVYLTYPAQEHEPSGSGDGAKREREGESTKSVSSSSQTDADDNADDNAIVTKLKTYLTAYIQQEPAPYNDQIISTLHLTPIRLPDASQSAVRAHFRTHYLNPAKHGPRYEAVLIVDTESHASILAGREPVLNLPTGKEYWEATQGWEKVFVKAVQIRYDEASGGEVLVTSTRERAGGIVWRGCLRVTPRSLMDLWKEIDDGQWERLLRRDDQVWDRPDFL